MAQLKYNGNVVNSTVSQLNNISNNWNSLIDEMKNATNIIVSSKGFDKYIGGIKSDSFSSLVSNCQTFNNDLINLIRQMQIEILSYSQDNNAIKAFLDELDLKDYKNLNMKPIEDHISFGRRASNIFKGFTSSLATSVLGVIEGIGNFGETGADLVVLGKSAISSIFTDSDTAKQMWEATKAKVSEKKVENAFNNFYNNTEFGQNIKNNAYGFDTVRSISNGIGYSSSVILTGGLATGVGLGSATTNLAATAGLMGFSGGTEEAWADGASIKKGLLYGAATGAWEGTQWAIGSGINNIYKSSNGLASNIFKGGLRGLATRTALESADAGVEGIVQPGLKMIYKDYEGKNLAEKYKTAFNEAGGWKNVRNQAILGGIMSSGSEFLEASAGHIFKSKSDRLYDDKSLNKLFDESDDASRIFLSKFSEGDSARYDSLFRDFDNNNHRYGVDQGICSDLFREKKLNNDWLIDKDAFKKYYFDKYSDYPESAVLASFNRVIEGNTISETGKDCIIEYLLQSTGSYDEALNMYNKSFVFEKSDICDKLVNKYMELGLTESEALSYFKRIDEVGACSYAAPLNGIVSNFIDKPEIFESKFGFPLFRDVDGKKVLNSEELLADFYTYANTKSFNPKAKLFDMVDNKLVILSDNPSDQVRISSYLSYDANTVENYLNSKSLNYELDGGVDRYDLNDSGLYGIMNSANITTESLYDNIKGKLDDGSFVQLSLYKLKDKVFSFYDSDGSLSVTSNEWSEGDAHAVYITDITENEVIISSWGERLSIPLSEFIENKFVLTCLKFIDRS